VGALCQIALTAAVDGSWFVLILLGLCVTVTVTDWAGAFGAVGRVVRVVWCGVCMRNNDTCTRMCRNIYDTYTNKYLHNTYLLVGRVAQSV